MSGQLLPPEEDAPKVQFDEDTFYIPDSGSGVSLCGHKTKCKFCGRKILVQLPLFGVPHHFDALASCAECLTIDDQFREVYPELAADLEKWAKETG